MNKVQTVATAVALLGSTVAACSGQSIQRIFGVDPSHTDPTTGLPFSWLRNASTASDFSSFFAPGQFP